MTHEHKSCATNLRIACCICQPHGCPLTNPTTPSSEQPLPEAEYEPHKCSKCGFTHSPTPSPDWKKRYLDILTPYPDSKDIERQVAFISDLLLEERARAHKNGRIEKTIENLQAAIDEESRQRK